MWNQIRFADKRLQHLVVSMGLSSAADATINVVIPLEVYRNTRDALLTALVAAAIAVGTVLGSFAVTRLPRQAKDAAVCAAADVGCALALATLLFLSQSVYVISIIVVTLTCSLLQSLRSGSEEAYMARVAAESNVQRQEIISKSRLVAVAGSAIGLLLAPFVLEISHVLAYSVAGALYIASAVAISVAPALAIPHGAKAAIRHGVFGAFSALFAPAVRVLSISHALAAISLFFFNATAVFILKGQYQVSDSFWGVFLTVQMVTGILGAFMIARVSTSWSATLGQAPLLRALYAVPFAVAALWTTPEGFVLGGMLLSMIHTFSIPIWQSLFQAQVPSDQWRAVGVARKALVAGVGTVSSLVAGVLISPIGITWTYLIAAAIAVVSSLTLLVYRSRVVPA